MSKATIGENLEGEKKEEGAFYNFFYLLLWFCPTQVLWREKMADDDGYDGEGVDGTMDLIDDDQDVEDEVDDEGHDGVEILDSGAASDSKAIPESDHQTTPYMTKYEKARILGTRALQISLNAPPMVDIEGEIDPLKIAEKELRQKKIPMIVRRYLPNGRYEDWTLDRLTID